MNKKVIFLIVVVFIISAAMCFVALTLFLIQSNSGRRDQQLVPEVSNENKIVVSEPQESNTSFNIADFVFIDESSINRNNDLNTLAISGYLKNEVDEITAIKIMSHYISESNTSGLLRMRVSIYRNKNVYDNILKFNLLGSTYTDEDLKLLEDSYVGLDYVKGGKIYGEYKFEPLINISNDSDLLPASKKGEKVYNELNLEKILLYLEELK